MRRRQNATMAQAEVAAKVPETAEAKELKEHAGLQFMIEGTDAMLVTGRFPQKKISELIKTVEGRDYLGTLWRTVPSDLRNIIRTHFGG
jgi:hypothetical protein